MRYVRLYCRCGCPDDAHPEEDDRFGPCVFCRGCPRFKAAGSKNDALRARSRADQGPLRPVAPRFYAHHVEFHREWDPRVAVWLRSFYGVLALLLFSGCAPLPRAEIGPALTERVKVTWADEPSAGKRARLERYVNEAERVYVARFGGRPSSAAALVFEPGYLLRSDHPGLANRRLLGYVTGFREIHLPHGGVWPGVAIIHELHHLALGGDMDPKHLDRSWRAVDHLGRAFWQEFYLGF